MNYYYSLFINILNISNQHRKSRIIIFTIIKDTRLIININNIFTTSFTINPKDNKSRRDKKNNNSAKTLKIIIKIILKNKKKGKYKKN